MLQNEIARQQLQFIIVNPSESIRIGRRYPLAWLATLISPVNKGATKATGSAVWVRSDSPVSELEDLEDLEGLQIGSVSRQAFGGYMAFAREVMKSGEHAELLKQVVEIGYPHEKVVAALLDHSIDAAILPICLVESLEMKGELASDRLKVLDNKVDDTATCKVSTLLYPNWSFAMTGNANRSLAKEIVQSLLAIPPDSEVARRAQSLGWSVPESQAILDELFNDLGVHPYQTKWWVDLWKWLINHSAVAILIAIVISILPIQYLYLSFLYRRNAAKLRDSQYYLQQVQRQALVDRLGSSLAHELNQPLSVIQLYAEGEIARRQSGRLDTDTSELLGKILRQVNRINSVVHRFRSLLQKRKIEQGQVNFSVLVEESLALVDAYARQHQVNILLDLGEEVFTLHGDKTGLEQMLINLLTNAIDATSETGGGRVFIHLQRHQKSIRLIISDEGRGLAGSFESLLAPFVSSKENGIGLGLAICKEVVEFHYGSFELRNGNSGGCQAIVQLPCNALNKSKEVNNAK